MIVKAKHGNREIRAAEFGSSQPLPWSMAGTGGGVSWAGKYIGPADALGLPAVAQAVKLISNGTAVSPLMVYRGTYGNRVTAEDSWQYKLLNNAPSLDSTPFNFIGDVAAGIEVHGNAFVQKIKSKGKVVELIPLDPNYCAVKNVGGMKQFTINVNGKTTTGLTTSEILHFRGFALGGSFSGLSPVSQHRHALGNALALEEFSGRYFAQDSTPSGYIKVPGNVKREQAREMLKMWEEQHGGLAHKHRPALLFDNAEFVQMGGSLIDAQYIQQMQFSIEEIARIMDVPPELLILNPQGLRVSMEEVGLRFLTFHLSPRLKRIEDTFNCDQDLFLNQPVYPEFVTDRFVQADMSARYASYSLGRQGGWLTLNDIRRKEGLHPLPGGDDLLQTPVGGAPNTPSPNPDKGDGILTDKPLA